MADTGQIGKYEIVEELGSGGFATVYRAVDTSLGRHVALKLLHPQLLINQSFVERFFREARILARLRHPNIVTIHEVGMAEGRVFLAMDLAASNLASAIAEHGPRTWAEVHALLDPVATALDYAHVHGVVHRDLKPANILLSDDSRPLLSDFGFARSLGDVSASLSVSSGILGTPSYIAPEVWDGQPAEAAADIYALACIAYVLFTGKVLFPGDTPLRAVAAHAAGPQLPPGWPLAVLAVFRTALAREPTARYGSAGAFAAALREATQPNPASTAATQPKLAAQERVVQRREPIKATARAPQAVMPGEAPIASPQISAEKPRKPQVAPSMPAATGGAASSSATISARRILLALAIGASGWAIFGLFSQRYNDAVLERLLINECATLLTGVALWVGGVPVSLRQFGAFAVAGLLPHLFLLVSRYGYFPFTWLVAFLLSVGLLVAYVVGQSAGVRRWATTAGVVAAFVLTTPVSPVSYDFIHTLVFAQTGDYSPADTLATTVALVLHAAIALLLTFLLFSRARRLATPQ